MYNLHKDSIFFLKLLNLQSNSYDIMEQRPNNKENCTPKQPSPRRDRLRLPFDNSKEDPISWIYARRIGLLITVVALFAWFIISISAKVGDEVERIPDTIYIDMSEVEVAENETTPKPQENQPSDYDWRSVRNLSSNEGVSNEALEDEKGTDVEALNAAAKAIEAERIANQKAYEKGLKDATTPIYDKKADKGANLQKDVKVKGRVTVGFSFNNPIRYSRYLVKPAYRCEGGGEVVVSVVLNQRGEVISAQVVSGGDECMRQTAVEAARNSRFDINNNAPTKQRGTITYTFIPQ